MNDILDDIENDKTVPGDAEKMLQQLLTASRKLLIEFGARQRAASVRLQRVESALENVRIILADGTSQLKQEVSKLFDTLENVDLKKIGALDAEESEVNVSVPRSI